MAALMLRIGLTFLHIGALAFTWEAEPGHERPTKYATGISHRPDRAWGYERGGRLMERRGA
jgi:hypothetical protein